MNKISLYIKTIILILAGSLSAKAQTASITAGCAELKVAFTAPQASSYYWKFGDGPASVSNLQNPVHSYVQASDDPYIAQLFDKENGTQIGDDIEITVYPPILIDINADVRTGCAPLEVNFSSSITINPDIDVKDIVWTFGDGNSASGQNTNYTYQEDGTYTVSVKVITTDSIKCDEPVIFEDFIVIEGQKTGFIMDRYSSCDIPATFTFTNSTNAPDGTTYFWDFGNGETRTGEGPFNMTYDEAGLYEPELTSTSPGGCISSKSRTISIGSPIIETTFPDTICWNVEIKLSQSTIAKDFIWDFTGTSIDTSLLGPIYLERRPVVTFTEPGLQTFTLTAIAPDSCETTETISVFVSKADASYTLGPDISCTDPIFIGYNANDPNLSSYTFNNDIFGIGEDETSSSPNGSTLYETPERDEYYVNTQDSVLTRLIVRSSYGCLDTAYNRYYLQKPEAFFIPDVVKGCIPFEVNFSDLSYSDHEIDTRSWDFGDGQGGVFSSEDTLVSHVYTTSGFHDVVLTITDQNDCIDISRKVRIIAIDKDTIPGAPSTGDCPDPICVGDSISILVGSNQVTTNLHIESDNGRYDHCWRDRLSTHTYLYPGVYPIDATFEFLTIYIDSIVTGCFLTVEGSRSDIDYAIECSNPYQVDFSGVNSINADSYTWYLENKVISTDPSFEYLFDERGTYTVYLETQQDGVGCTHRDSAMIHITDIKAGINIPDKSCASTANPLSASGSQDVYNKCHAGYIWQFENQRPREVNDSIIFHRLLPGFQRVTLIVEDINGCKDTTSATTTAYDLQAEFVADTLICLPSDIQLTNLSVGDTTIASYDWDFGGSTSIEKDPIHEFNEGDYDENYESDSITVILFVEDVIGCIDSTSLLIETYDIISELYMNNGPDICQNETIKFDAADYNLGGSFLTYEWQFGQVINSTESQPSVTFTEAGDYLIQLTFTEDATGCQGTLDTVITVRPTPVADFISDQDAKEFICFPEQISFSNTSQFDSLAMYQWDFGNGAQSDIEDPIIPFDKGTYEVQMIVSTQLGCMDTITQSYTLVGPEGNFTVDKDVICPGEEITVTLESSIDVSSYTWDFGDGVQVNNQSPVTHTYNTAFNSENFKPTLILRSDENGCELIQDIPISVSSISSDFDNVSDICPGIISLSSQFDNPQTIEWNIDGEIINGTSTPTVTTSSMQDSLDVILTVTDFFGCEIQRIKRIVNNQDIGFGNVRFPNVFSPNGDAFNQTFNITRVLDPEHDDDEVEVIAFKVYDRWGELLYNNSDPVNGWNGFYKGAIVPADIYAYYIEISINGCQAKSKKGNVTVIK